jgi:kynurenine formamidase
LKLLKIHDLTHTISPDMQVYPGDPQPKFEPHATKRIRQSSPESRLAHILAPILMRRGTFYMLEMA